MSLTILKVLKYAKYNLKGGNSPFQQRIGRNQLDNAIKLLEKGKKPKDNFREDDLREEGK